MVSVRDNIMPMNRTHARRSTMLLRLAAVPLLVAALPAAVALAGSRQADTVMLNGAILVFQGIERNGGAKQPKFAQAVAIADGRIMFIGQTRKAKKYVGPATRVIDLEGRMVMPGIVDGHFHGTRLTDGEMEYEGGTVAQVLAKRQACLDRPDQAAFKGTNVRMAATHIFGEAIVPPGTALTRDDLDRLDTTRPVMVENADGHKVWVNSRAIENARIDEKTPDQPGGMIGRADDRKPNGAFSYVDGAGWGHRAQRPADGRT